MKRVFENALRARRELIRTRWLEILLVEPVNTPLAEPRILAFLLDHSLDAVFATLSQVADVQPAPPAACSCGRNPFLAYFRAGTQALLEALVFVLAAAPTLDPGDRDAAFAELQTAIDRVAREEIEVFGSLCAHPERTRRRRPRHSGIWRF